MENPLLSGRVACATPAGQVGRVRFLFVTTAVQSTGSAWPRESAAVNILVGKERVVTSVPSTPAVYMDTVVTPGSVTVNRDGAACCVTSLHLKNNTATEEILE